MTLGALLPAMLIARDAWNQPSSPTVIINGATPMIGFTNGHCVSNNSGTAGDSACSGGAGTVAWIGPANPGNCPVIYSFVAGTVTLADSGAECLLGNASGGRTPCLAGETDYSQACNSVYYAMGF